MSQLEKTIKDLIFFYVKENYNDYLKKNDMTKIEKEKISIVIEELYDNKKNHLKQFLKDALNELLKEDYPGDLIINNICFEIFQDDNFAKNRICKEIELHQENIL